MTIGAREASAAGRTESSAGARTTFGDESAALAGTRAGLMSVVRDWGSSCRRSSTCSRFSSCNLRRAVDRYNIEMKGGRAIILAYFPCIYQKIGKLSALGRPQAASSEASIGSRQRAGAKLKAED